MKILSRWFGARWDGRCAACRKPFYAGDLIAYQSDENFETTFVALMCCEGKGLDTPAVMPKGKTAVDKCPECFMVHSPGQKGCE